MRIKWLIQAGLNDIKLNKQLKNSLKQSTTSLIKEITLLILNERTYRGQYYKGQ